MQKSFYMNVFMRLCRPTKFRSIHSNNWEGGGGIGIEQSFISRLLLALWFNSTPYRPFRRLGFQTKPTKSVHTKKRLRRRQKKNVGRKMTTSISLYANSSKLYSFEYFNSNLLIWFDGKNKKYEIGYHTNSIASYRIVWYGTVCSF